jgi:hypothetical protein
VSLGYVRELRKISYKPLSTSLCVCGCNRVCPDSLSATKKWVVCAGLADMEDGGCCAAEILGQLLQQLFRQPLRSSSESSSKSSSESSRSCSSDSSDTSSSNSSSESYYSSFEKSTGSSADSS